MVGVAEQDYPLKFNDEHFARMQRGFQGAVEEGEITPSRLEEIATLASEISGGKMEIVDAQKDLNPDSEVPCLLTLINTLKELELAKERGDLNPEQVENWRERFLFQKPERDKEEAAA